MMDKPCEGLSFTDIIEKYPLLKTAQMENEISKLMRQGYLQVCHKHPRYFLLTEKGKERLERIKEDESEKS